MTLNEEVGYRSRARGELGCRHLSNVLERGSIEVDHEVYEPAMTRRAGARRRDPGSAPRDRRLLSPAQPVGEAMRRARLEWLGGLPIYNNIVVNLFLGRDFDQLHVAFAPASSRLDPCRRS